MIAGFEAPSDGSIIIGGTSVGDMPPHRRDVNTVFQSYALFPHLSVRENVAFGLQMKGVPKAEIATRVQAALELVQLPGFGDRKPRQLSGGQQQRVALARAVINRPKVLLLDEPLAALDLKLRKEMQIELKMLQERLGITFIFVTHDQEEALSLSDRIAVMNHGSVLQVGPPAEIYERPLTQFVADFIGECNFLPGRVTAISDGIAEVETSSALRISGTAPQPVAPGDQVMIAIRPEKVRLIEGERPSISNAFPVQIERVAYIGSDTRIIVRLPDGSSFDVWESNTISTLDPAAYYAAGDKAWLTWTPQNALVLTE